jgi:DNA-binding GntR family transcriptional regulator
MAAKRADSFRIALDTLRDELRRGVHRAGARLTANDIASRLALSTTPAREALSRLAGEGLLQDRRGQGFFVTRLSEHDLALLFRLQRDLLLIVCDERSPRPGPDSERREPGETREARPPDAVLASERLFRAFAGASSPTLARHLSRLLDQLASVRAMEARVLERLPEEFADLEETVTRGDPESIRRTLDAFFARRIQAAPALARLHDAAENIESI